MVMSDWRPPLPTGHVNGRCFIYRNTPIEVLLGLREFDAPDDSKRRLGDQIRDMMT